VLGEAQRPARLPEGFLKHPAAADQLNAAHVLSFEDE
jgi:hypothetical protein